MINIYQPSLGKEELSAIADVFESNWLGKGKLTEEFTEQMALKLSISRNNVETISCCTEGMFQSMKLLGIHEGDEVIIPSIHFIGAVNAIVESKVTPVFCDVNQRTLNVEWQHIARKISSKTKAVMLLHYGGVPCDFDEIKQLCDRYGINIIEDNANSPLSIYRGESTGTLGDIGVWSFDSMKQIVMGDGGLIYCKDENLINDIKQETYLGLLSGSGFSNSIDKKWWEFNVDRPGRRAIINDIQAAMGLEQLKKIDKFIDVRREIHDIYTKELSELEWLQTPMEISKDRKSSYYMYHVQLDDRDELANHLKDNGIYTTFRYYPLHRVEYFQNHESFENADYVADHTLCLPLHQSLSNQDVDHIINTVRNYK
tara:strand:+ start:2436 stop:3548 length:1113 start_codon:yes stop_codon:yes gene_type:complete